MSVMGVSDVCNFPDMIVPVNRQWATETGVPQTEHHVASTAEEPDSPDTSALFCWDDGESDRWTVTSEMS